MNIGKVLTVVLLAGLILLSGINYYYKNINDDKNDLTITPGCEDFNGKNFLLSGGTGTPENINEINYELNRLNWLCNGVG